MRGGERTNRNEASFLNLLTDLAEEKRIILFQPSELLSLRSDEAMLRVTLDEVELRRPRSAHIISLRSVFA